jgi:hypothetical protein
MGKAYDHAAKILHDKGPPSLEQEALAQRIIFLAGRGERDPRTLAHGTRQSGHTFNLKTGSMRLAFCSWLNEENF